MYRSNDVVRLAKGSIYVRPFVKVGEDAKEVKVFQFHLEDVLVAQTAASSKRMTTRRTLAQHVMSSCDTVDSATTSASTI